MNPYTTHRAPTYNEFMSSISKEAQSKIYRIKNTCEAGKWEPVTFDKYDADSGKWSFKKCFALAAHYVRHTETGKLYRWNQRRRIFAHEFELEYGWKL